MLRYRLVSHYITLILELWLSHNIFELGRNYVHVNLKSTDIQE